MSGATDKAGLDVETYLSHQRWFAGKGRSWWWMTAATSRC